MKGPPVMEAMSEEIEVIEKPKRPRSRRPAFRSGFVAVLGRANAGKSTLVNAMAGTKVAIVSPKPQTTRMSLQAVVNRPNAQIIFVDTPGVHTPRW